MVKNKSIILLSSEFPPGPGGIGNHAYNLSKKLSEENYDVCVITPIRPKYFDKNFEKNKKFKISWYKNSVFKLNAIKLLFKKLMYFTSKSEIPLIIASGLLPMVLIVLFSSIINIWLIRF